MSYIKLLLLFVIITVSAFQNAQASLLWKVVNIKYQCNYPGCSSLATVSASSLENCQMACVGNTACRTVTFDATSDQCQLHSDIPNQSCKQLSQTGVTTMSTTDNEQSSARK
ncbi:unnamed protein product [Adineta ricciae]|uniref:Apple domain-containing protein n=1 Tax=Adineta ricciae TaxID=249248 RepID=A0A813V455_ADIRI|nr:unnamed protein product [Adineta ricciae]CAF1394525.1 unnamed protein product [Adineta ricciae]